MVTDYMYMTSILCCFTILTQHTEFQHAAEWPSFLHEVSTPMLASAHLINIGTHIMYKTPIHQGESLQYGGDQSIIGYRDQGVIPPRTRRVTVSSDTGTEL